MDDLERLVTLLKYCSDNLDYDGLNTLHDVVTNRSAFGDPEHDVEEAGEVALHMLHTLYDIDGAGEVIYGRPKLNMEKLMGDLVIMLERMHNHRDGSRDSRP
jgi:hypothetical protein